MSSQQSGARGPGQDERLEQQTRGQVQGAGHSTHAQEWREPEPAGEDQPTGDQGIVPEDRRGTPAGMTSDDVETRSDVARYLGNAYPADRDALVQTARDNQAPDEVLSQLRSLPSGQEFENVQDVARALGLGTETERT